jgi:hypothetical protein
MNANIRWTAGVVMTIIFTTAVFPNGLPHEPGCTHGFMALTAAYAIAAAGALLIPRMSRLGTEERFGAGLASTSPTQYADTAISK